MKRTAKQCLYYLVILAMIAGTSRAQNESSGTARVSDEPIPLPSGQSSVFLDSGAPPSGFFPMTSVERWFAPRYYVDSRAGTLYGYEESFTNIGAFLPKFIEDNAMVFADAKGMVGYDGRGGANLGLGWRYYIPELDRYFGLNTWYDFDAGHVEEYHQVGVGFESIGRYFDMIVNGYIPVSSNSNQISTRYGNTATFLDNRLMLNRFDEWESAFTGFDANIGGPMPIFGRYGLQGYVGFYFFTNSASTTDFTGVSGRLAWQVNEDFNIGVNFSDDHVFGTNTQMQFTMTIPDGKPSRWLRPLSVRDRMMQSVMRNNRVTVDREIRLSLEAARNPKDSQPYFVVHVDPNVAGNGVAAGDGTVENPYNLLSQFDNLALADKSEVDIIYVRPRFDETSTNLNEGVTLLSCQRLLSTSVEHFFEAEQVPGFQFTLPGHRPGDPLPRLTNDSGLDVVTLADGAFMIEVSGFEINGSATGRGIAGTNNRNININRNVISNARDGIHLTNLTGTQATDEGSFITSNIIRNNDGDGIFVENTGVGPLDLVIANNPPRTTNFDGVLEIDLTGDGIPDIGIPDSLDGDGSFANDGILSNGDDGIDIRANDGSLITLAIDDNSIRGNQDNGIELTATNGSTIRGAITDNVINGNQNNAIAMTAVDSTLDFFNLLPGGLQGEISGNEIRDNVDDGIEINATNSTTAFDIHTNRFGVNSFNLNDPNLLVGQNGGWGINLNAEGGTTLIEIGGPTAAEGNLFLDPGFGAVIYNLSGDNVTESNVQFNRVISGVSAVSGDLIRLGLDQFTLARNDDGSTALVPVGFNANFFGLNFNQVFVNNNGNITFNSALGTFTPFPIVQNGIPMIAPFFADVDTRNHGNPVTYGTGTVNGRDAFAVNWIDVDYFASSPTHGNQLNTFQLVLIDRSDIAPGDFDIEFNYDTITWEAGNASGGVNGLGGSSARVGFTNGTTNSFELPGSAVNGAFLDSGPAATSLVQNSLNSQLLGRYVFQARNGGVVDPNAGNNAPPAGDAGAIVHNVTDTARLVNSFVQDNTVTGQSNANDNQFALVVNTSSLGRVEDLTVQRNTFNQNDGGMLFTRDNSSLLQALVQNNTVNQNRGNGWQVIANGTAVNGVAITSQDNVFNANEADGLNVYTGGNTIMTFDSIRDRWTNSGGDGIQTVSDNGSELTMTFQNVLSTGAAGSGFNAEVLGTSITDLDISSPVDPLFTGTRSSFSSNGAFGFQMEAAESGLALVNIDNTLFDNNGGDGLNFNREDASLILAQIANSTVSNNGDDGIQFYTSGGGVDDPTTPLYNGGLMRAPANRLELDNVTITGQANAAAANGANGLETATLGNSFLVVNATNSRFTSNAADGIRSFAGQASSYGDRLTGERSTFDGVTITDNGLDGMRIFAQGINTSTPTALVEVNSASGTTLIARNGDDGIEASVTYGDLDLLVNGGPGTFNTVIQRNGLTSDLNGHGIEFNVGDAAQDNDTTQGANSIAQFFFPNPLNGDPTFQIIQAPGDAILAMGTLTVNDTIVGDENVNNSTNTGNAGDGIRVHGGITSSYVSRFQAGSPNGAIINTSLDIIPVSQAVVNVDSSELSGNGGNGIGFIGVSGTTTQLTHTINNNAGGNSTDVLTQSVQFLSSITNSDFIRNGNDGISMQLSGRFGRTFLGPQNLRVDGNSFFIDNNIIERNGRNGMFFESNAGNQAFARVYFQDGVIPPGTGAFNPAAVGNASATSSFIFNSRGFGSFLDVSSDAITDMVFTRNTVRFNGSGNAGDGVMVRVSTNSYLGLDMGGAAGSGLGNTFSGNTLADVTFESFIAFNPTTGVFEVPPASSSGAAPTQDQVSLDHTAQLDLRFNNNTGSEVSAPFVFAPGQAAVYTTGDALKGGGPRNAQLFQLDGGFAVNGNNNWGAQNLQNIFSNGDFFLRGVNDAAFPNPAFPENWATDPFDPFLP